MRTFFVLALLLSLFPQIASACMMSAETKERIFKSFDTNNNGLVTRQEYVNGESAIDPQHREFYDKRFDTIINVQKKDAVGLDEFQPVARQKGCH